MWWIAAALGAELVKVDVTPCDGAEIPPGSKVTVHYVGRVQGAEQPFDSSRAREQAAKFTIGKGELITGWEQGMHGMSVGCTRRLVVPPALAFGEKGRPPVIPENATLEFEIELLALEFGRAPPLAPRAVPAWEETATGVRYHDFVVGDGAMPEPGQEVTVEYTLWLPDGTRVDSSLDRAGPFSYRAGRGQVIKGWEEAVLGMRVGGVRQFRVPYRLGYGVQGRPPTIPPKSELVFEVTLVRVGP